MPCLAPTQHCRVVRAASPASSPARPARTWPRCPSRTRSWPIGRWRAGVRFRPDTSAGGRGGGPAPAGLRPARGAAAGDRAPRRAAPVRVRVRHRGGVSCPGARGGMLRRWGAGAGGVPGRVAAPAGRAGRGAAGRCARWDLRGGPPATAVPTAIGPDWSVCGPWSDGWCRTTTDSSGHVTCRSEPLSAAR
jgi:hypothetical protein